MIALHGHRGRLGQLILSEGVRAGATLQPLLRDGPLPADASVVVDVTSPQGLADLLDRLAAHPVPLPLLVGTTGALPWPALERHAARAPVAVVPNFSVGVPLLLDLLRHALPALPPGWDIEIVEGHHNQKKDAPSGTALRIAQAITDADADRPTPPIHSLRVGDTLGQHTVWLAGPGERIELTHIATRREVFALGALRWAQRLPAMPAGLHRP